MDASPEMTCTALIKTQDYENKKNYLLHFYVRSNILRNTSTKKRKN